MKSSTPGRIFVSRFQRDRMAIGALALLFAIAGLVLSAPLIAEFIAHQGPNEVELEALDDFGMPSGPSRTHWFGTDTAGRDLFVRVLYGARASLTVALLSTGLAVVIGVALGVVAGYFGGSTDALIGRAIDVLLSLPVLLLGLGIVAACGVQASGCLYGLVKPGIALVTYAIALFSWPYIARVVRGQTLSIREQEFIEAARSTGASSRRIILREVMPNVVSPVIVFATFLIPINIQVEAALSFLGIGVPPSTPSWGSQIAQAMAVFPAGWWLMLFPGALLFVTTMAFNLVGDGLRDALDVGGLPSRLSSTSAPQS
jgi:peptide/nickel transport system permease protein